MNIIESIKADRSFFYNGLIQFFIGVVLQNIKICKIYYEWHSKVMSHKNIFNLSYKMILPLLLAVMIQVSHWYLCSAPYPQEYRVPSRTRYLVTPATYSSMWLIGSAALGMISDSIYTLGEVNSGTSFLRKIDKNDQELWIKMYNINPAEATLSIARDESFLLYTQNSHFPLILLDTNTGNLLKSYDNASILWDVRFTIIVVASDNSGVYFNQVNSIASFWRFMFSTSTADWFRFTGWSKFKGIHINR